MAMPRTPITQSPEDDEFSDVTGGSVDASQLPPG